MSSSSTVVSFRQPDAVDDPLTAVLRDGARQRGARIGWLVLRSWAE